MCTKTSQVGEEKQSTRSSERIKKRKHRESTTMDKSLSSIEASRKIRTNTKKTKFLSLKKRKKKSKKQSKTKRADTTAFKEKKRADALGGEKEDEQYDTVADYLFKSATESTISSIDDLLPSSTTADVDCWREGRNLSPYGLQEHVSSSSSLLRTAMRKGASEEEEETTEERWVSYSEVMSRRSCDGDGNDGRPSLVLKLNYEQIMEIWSEKGSFYVDDEPPQTVPDLHASADVFTDGGDGEAGSLWRVPEMETKEKLWRGHREASLLRYKEKRQNRLFSKQIRYQVRKLNAEKRPRIKGRFVKGHDS